MFRYAFKRVIRGYKLTGALMAGVLIATTFFASMLMTADVVTTDAVKTALEGTDYDIRVVANNITWSTTDYNDLENILLEQPEVVAAERYAALNYAYNESAGQSFTIVGLEKNSLIWRGLEYINGTDTLSVNETYVVASSVNASLLSIGQVLQVPVYYQASTPPFIRAFYVNLTVAGFVEISENTARLLNPPRYLSYGFIQIEIGDWRQYNFLLVDWDLTFAPLIEHYEQQEDTVQMGVTEGFLCRLDRETVINPYDLSGSITRVETVIAKISDRTAIFNTQVLNLIGPVLTLASFVSTILILAFLSLAAPIIFMSWYSSTMLSDVSYNLRRREFGLLQTKGFGPKAIKQMLMLEGVITGIISGIIGLVLGTVLAHLIASAPLENTFSMLASSYVNDAVVVVFALIISVWAVRGPSTRAASLEPLDSLKQYVYVEEQREYRKLLPTISLILGTYKIIVWALGINMTTFLSTAFSVNLILFIAVALWTPVDAFLNFAGPIMFLYGLTKILLRGSQKFQEGIIQIAKRFFGAFGRLATRNVQRNPMRNAALVFVVSLIVSYGVFSVGSLFTEQDLLTRTNLYEVGSDVSATFPTGYNMSGVVTNTLSLEGVENVTTEYWITLSTTQGTISVRGVNTTNWEQAAFYEDGWFVGPDINTVLENFTGKKILLSIAVARQLELRVGNLITILGPLSNQVYQMEIVGLVGYASPLEDVVGQFAFTGNYPSFVPADFLENTSLIQYAEPHLLIKTKPGVNGTEIESQITALYPDVKETDSFTSRMVTLEETNVELASIRSRWLGIAFAVVLAVIGTALVVWLTLNEKEYEVTLLGVRGFERGQILKVLFAEVLVMVVFSLLLGVSTGMIQLFGDVANRAQNTTTLIMPRIVLNVLTITGMAAVVLAVLMAALIPVLFASRLTEEKIATLRE